MYRSMGTAMDVQVHGDSHGYVGPWRQPWILRSMEAAYGSMEAAMDV